MAQPDPYTMDWTEAAGRLARAASTERGWYMAVVTELVHTEDRVAFDVGCGGAGMSVAMATVLPESGRVVAADHSADVLDAARSVVAGAEGLRAPVEFALVDLDQGVEPLRELGPADLVWASASVHHAGDQQAAVNALVGLLAPGGRLALAEGGLKPRYLPWDLGVGEPGLELRLDLAQDRWFARMRAGLPGYTPMPYGWTEALRRAGLRDVTTRTTLLERPVPLSDADRERVVDSLTNRVQRLYDTDLLSDADRQAWERLLDPAGEDWLGRRGDLYSLDARSVQIGTAG